MAYTANPVWTFLPNWDNGILERLEWKTDVLTSETADEQRLSRRLTPRRTLEARFLIHATKRQELEGFLATKLSSRVVIPLWYEVTRLTAPSAAGTNTISLDTRWREYKVGGLVYLYSTTTNAWEVHTISGKTDTSLTLISNLDLDWVAGVNVYPGKLAIITEKSQVSKKTDRAIELTAEFRLVESNPYSSLWLPKKDYRGSSMIETPPDDSEDLTHELQRMLSMVDNEIGVADVADLPQRGFKNYSYRWSFAGAQKAEEFRRMLYYLGGRRRPIWVPTFMDDLQIVAPITAFDSTLQVANVGFTRMNALRPGTRDIRIALRDKYILYRRILSSIESSASVETLSLDAPIFFDLALSDISYTSFMMSSRLDQDTIEIDHRADSEGLMVCTVIWREDVDPGTVWRTSRPFALSPLDEMIVSASLVDGQFLFPPLDEMNISATLEPTGVLADVISVYYGLWPFEAMDMSVNLEPTGTLRALLLYYGNWPDTDERIDMSINLEPTGTLLVKLVTYPNWPVTQEQMDFSANLEPTGTLA